MPASVVIPSAVSAGLGLLGMIDANTQNKAAQKNNQNQQQSAVQNSQAAWQHAQQQLAQWMTANPAPFAGGINIARPTPYGAPPVAASSTATTAPTAPPAPTAPSASAPPNLAHLPPAALHGILQRLVALHAQSARPSSFWMQPPR